MLTERIQKYLNDQGNGRIEIYSEEKEFAEKHQLIPDGAVLELKDSDTRFADAYIERGEKETEAVLGKETAEFLNQPIDYFKKHKNEFMYLESGWFDIVGADAVSFEIDDLFGNYDVMLGLKLPKKSEIAIRSFLHKIIQEDSAKYDLIFNQPDGLWDLNFALNNIKGFRENVTIGEAYNLIYIHLFNLAEEVEKEMKR